MSEVNELSNAIEDTTDLDAFSAELLGTAKPEPVQADAPSDEDADDTSTGDTPDTNEPVEDTEADPDSNEGDDKPEEVVEKPKKKTAQERISEVIGERNEARERASALEARIAAIEAGKAKPVEAPAPTVVTDNGAPDPDATNEDGSLKYPLGEYDSAFLRDNARYILKSEKEAFDREQAETAQQEAEIAARTELQKSWEAKVQSAEATDDMADIREVGMQLVENFADLEPAYGDYLANTIMDLENGPEVFYYLANNVTEARKIANLGPVKATIALGGLDARIGVSKAPQENGTQKTRMTQAPEPPKTVNRGTNGKFDTPDDTDDLAAFEAKLYRKK